MRPSRRLVPTVFAPSQLTVGLLKFAVGIVRRKNHSELVVLTPNGSATAVTSNCPASSLTVRSPLRAARATCALNAAVCCFRLPAIVPPFLGHHSSLAGGPVFG